MGHPLVDDPPQLTIEQKKADDARLKAGEEQGKAIAAGVNVQNDDYQAACRRMEEAENLYKKGYYKQAESKFYLAVNQFSATCHQKATGGKTIGGDGKTTASKKPATAYCQTTTGGVQSTIGDRQTVGIQLPPPTIESQPTIEQKKADWARLKAVEEQKKARDAGIDRVDTDGWKAACSRMQGAEQAYRDGKYKESERGFNKATMAFEKMLEKTNPNGQKE